MGAEVPSGLNSQLWQMKAGQPYKRNTGIILTGGSITTPNSVKGYQKFGALSPLTACSQPTPNIGTLVPNNYRGLGFIQEGTPVTITSITQSGSFTLLTKSSHGLSVGTVLQINGCSNDNYNIVHTIKAINNANSFQTDCVYTSNPSTAGTYSPINGTFAKVTKNKYVASLVCQQLAGVTNNALFMMGAANVKAYNPANPSYGLEISGIDYFNGTVTHGSQWGQVNNFWNITGNTTLSTESPPTRAIPGQLVYTTGALIPSTKNYNAKTE